MSRDRRPQRATNPHERAARANTSTLADITTVSTTPTATVDTVRLSHPYVGPVSGTYKEMTTPTAHTPSPPTHAATLGIDRNTDWSRSTPTHIPATKKTMMPRP